MALKSMTAFGSGECTSPNSIYRCEVRTLNSRFCDISIKMSRSLIAIEPKLMNRTKERILRGKVDIFLDILPADRSASLPKLNAAAVAHYLDLCRQLDAAAGQPLRTLAAAEMLRLEGVLENQYSASSEETVRLHEEGLLIALDKALDAVVKQRRSEGDALGGALAKLVEGMSEDRLAITAKREGIQKSLYETYRKRLDRLLQAIEETGQKVSSLLPEERLLSEITILTDRSDIEEELTRLAAHEQEFLKLLKGGEEVGRRMDFLCQEMHREVNTISNKLTQLDVAQHSMSLKQTVERLRQQVQNIE